MAWYWYITGIVTSFTLMSLVINYMLVSGFMEVTVRRPHKKKMHVVYDWQDHTDPTRRAI